jgi:hypothetical protein
VPLLILGANATTEADLSGVWTLIHSSLLQSW